MARTNLKDKNTRKLYKNSGGTTLVSIPKEIVTALKWRDGQKVVVKKSGNKVVVEDWS